jgi:UDP-glucose 4-epimerase
LTEKWPGESQKFLQENGEKLQGKKALVTGGASFIGSHLVEALLDNGCEVLVIDDLSSGSLENLPTEHPLFTFEKNNILHIKNMEMKMQDKNFVFHLAAIHGGRGFIETQQQLILQNIGIDNLVFNEAVKMGVDRIIYASSACAYPINQQESIKNLNLLSESNSGKIINNNANPDGVYGWAKLVGEFQLENYVTQGKSSGVAARIFTAYGPRENESHAAIALISKALLNMNPYQIWGNGTQTRNFTFVTDTVCGLIGAAMLETNANFEILNIGTNQHNSVMDFVNKIFENLNLDLPNFDFQIDKPTGVASRASDNSKILKSLRWEPSVNLENGINNTIDWYVNKPDRPKSIEELNLILNSR